MLLYSLFLFLGFANNWNWLNNEYIITLPEEFDSPLAMDIDADGNFYFLDAGTNKAYKMAPNGDILFSFGRKGEGPGELNTPYSFGIDRKNKRLWVKDFYTTNLFCFDLEGTLLYQKNISDWKARHLSVRPDGKLYMVGRSKDKYNLALYDQGELEQWFGRKVIDPMYNLEDQLHQDVTLHTDEQGNLYVLFHRAPRIMSYTPDLKERWVSERPWLGQEEEVKASLKGMRLLGSEYHLSLFTYKGIVYASTEENESALIAFSAENGKYMGHKKMDFRVRNILINNDIVYMLDSFENKLHVYGLSEKASPFKKIVLSQTYSERYKIADNVKTLAK